MHKIARYVAPVALLAALAGCAPGGLLTPADDNTALATACLVLASIDGANPSPTPTPGPKPAPGFCVNCNGTGRLGDGTISVICPVCDGKGKITDVPDLEVPVVDIPIDGEPYVEDSMWKVRYDGLIYTLMSRGREYPNGVWKWWDATGRVAYMPITVVPNPNPLPDYPKYPIRGGWWSGCGSYRHLMSGEHRGKFDTGWLAQLTNAEVQSLHSDDHEGRVKESFVKRPAGYGVKQRTTTSSGCPSGNCPSSRGRARLFGGS